MKSHQTVKKLGKRTFTLKELAQRDFVKTPKEDINDENLKGIAPIFNLVNIQEDLLDELVPTEAKTPTLEQSQNLAMPIDLIQRLIEKEVEQAANQLGLEKDELQAWVDLQVMTPALTLLSLLRIAKTYGLDPLKEEVTLALFDDVHWQAYITVEGYSKILNSHPAFDGIVFNESPESTNGIPTWMECVIYRKDRSFPVAVREYFEEVKGEQAIWQKMPRRMLRHRVMQQCARLAMG